MRIQIFSDIHAEFGIQIRPKNTDADLVISAGDFSSNPFDYHFLREWFPNSKIIAVAGNHEYYSRQFSLENIKDKIKKECDRNDIIFLDKDYLVIDNVLIYGSTLWTNYGLYGDVNRHKYQHYNLNDMNYISSELTEFTPEFCLQENKDSIEKAINAFYEVEYDKSIFVSHHGFSAKSINESKYAGSLLNVCFTSNLDHLIETLNCDLAIHGHTHDSFDYNIGRTRVLVNPKGYETRSGKSENTNFNDSLVVTI